MVGDGSPDRRSTLVGGGLAEVRLKDTVHSRLSAMSSITSESGGRLLSLFSAGSYPRTSQSGLNVDTRPCRFMYLCVKEPSDIKPEQAY
jgi:hypothetical protein